MRRSWRCGSSFCFREDPSLLAWWPRCTKCSMFQGGVGNEKNCWIKGSLYIAPQVPIQIPVERIVERIVEVQCKATDSDGSIFLKLFLDWMTAPHFQPPKIGGQPVPILKHLFVFFLHSYYIGNSLVPKALDLNPIKMAQNVFLSKITKFLCNATQYNFSGIF